MPYQLEWSLWFCYASPMAMWHTLWKKLPPSDCKTMYTLDGYPKPTSVASRVSSPRKDGDCKGSLTISPARLRKLHFQKSVEKSIHGCCPGKFIDSNPSLSRLGCIYLALTRSLLVQSTVCVPSNVEVELRLGMYSDRLLCLTKWINHACIRVTFRSWIVLLHCSLSVKEGAIYVSTPPAI